MSKVIVAAFIFLLLIACGGDHSESQKSLPIEADRFEFDGLEHFHSDITSPKLMELQSKKNKTKGEDILVGVLSFDLLDTLADTMYLKKLTSLGFKRRKISPKKFGLIRKIFSVSDEPEYVTPFIPEYRDILVFRKNNKVKGLARICFTCNQSSIIGQGLISELGGEKWYDSLAKCLAIY